ncbi:MAG: hypothetical protein Q8L27_02955 [archaeon]|nr:hypothetical protein [archaeon]
MKLQKQLSKRRGDKKYFRYTINISNSAVEQAGFKEGEELVAEGKKGEIKIYKLGKS